MIEENVLVLSANKWDFKDDDGVQRKGTTLWLVHLNNNDEYTNGLKPVKYTLQNDLMTLLDNIKLPSHGIMLANFDFVRSRILPTGFKSMQPLKLGALNE